MIFLFFPLVSHRFPIASVSQEMLGLARHRGFESVGSSAVVVDVVDRCCAHVTCLVYTAGQKTENPRWHLGRWKPKTEILRKHS